MIMYKNICETSVIFYTVDIRKKTHPVSVMSCIDYVRKPQQNVLTTNLSNLI